jgi:hypothetical protein
VKQTETNESAGKKTMDGQRMRFANTERTTKQSHQGNKAKGIKSRGENIDK